MTNNLPRHIPHHFLNYRLSALIKRLVLRRIERNILVKFISPQDFYQDVWNEFITDYIRHHLVYDIDAGNMLRGFILKLSISCQITASLRLNLDDVSLLQARECFLFVSFKPVHVFVLFIDRAVLWNNRNDALVIQRCLIKRGSYEALRVTGDSSFSLVLLQLYTRYALS